ncbi:MAG: hypothetical protein QXE66_02705 [Desulfurococcaceae archaeon]
MKGSKQQERGRLVTVWLPNELYVRFLIAREAYGFPRDATFAKYIIQRWLEDHWFLVAPMVPRPQLSPPAGVHAEQRGPNPGDEPGLGRVVEGVGDGG